MSDVFISYASEDRERARVLASALEATGVSVWWDRRLRPGQSFDEVIEEALDSAKCAIVLWSPASAASNWVRGEAGEALSRGILIPALIEETRIPLEFRRIHAADLTAWAGDAAHPEFQTLLNEVAALLGEPTQPAPAEPIAAASTPSPAATPEPEPPPAAAAAAAANWQAELIAGSDGHRLLRVTRGGLTHLVEYHYATLNMYVRVDGILVARGAFSQRFEFSLGMDAYPRIPAGFLEHTVVRPRAGAQLHPAIADARVDYRSGRILSFRLTIDGTAVYVEGKW